MRARLALAVVLGVASIAAARPPGAAGRHAVGVGTHVFTDVTRGRTLVTEIWYPARAPGRDAPLARGRFRLVLLAHGLCGSRLLYAYLTAHLAGRGFVVAAPDFPGINAAACAAGGPRGDFALEPPRDLSYLRATLHDPSGPAPPFAAVLRGSQAAVVGHSLGGLAVLNATLADANLRPAVALAPAASPTSGERFVGLRPRRAVMVMGGTEDTLIRFEPVVAPLFAALPAPAFLVKLIGGTHAGFAGAQVDRDALARQQRLVRRYATAFLARYLARDRRFARYLTRADAAAQGGDVELRARQR